MERSRSRDSGRDRDDSRGGRDRDDSHGGRNSGRSGGRDEGRGSGRGGSSRGYTYQKRSAEEVNKRASQGGKDFDSYLSDVVKSFKVNDGSNTLRVVPPTWDDPKHYGIDLWVHYGVGPDEQSYLCAHKMKGEACPICEELQRARQDRESEDYIKSLEPTKRVLFYLVDRDNEKEGVQAWAAPWTIDRDLLKISVDRRTNEVLPIDDPEEGYDVEFEKTGKGIGTKYVGIAIARRSSDLGNPEWLDFAIDNPLPNILVYHGYDHIQKVFGVGGAGSRGRSERDDAHSDRDSSRSSRDRDSGSSRGDRDRDGGRDTGDRGGRDRGGRSERGGRDAPKHTWDSVHALEGDALDALIEAEKLDLDPNRFDSDEEVADAICEELGLKKEVGNDDRMAAMRGRRNRV